MGSPNIINKLKSNNVIFEILNTYTTLYYTDIILIKESKNQYPDYYSVCIKFNDLEANLNLVVDYLKTIKSQHWSSISKHFVEYTDFEMCYVRGLNTPIYSGRRLDKAMDIYSRLTQDCEMYWPDENTAIMFNGVLI